VLYSYDLSGCHMVALNSNKYLEIAGCQVLSHEIETTLPNGEVHNDETYGVLKLNPHPKGYDWPFITVEGEALTE
jgi:hypothetical protein